MVHIQLVPHLVLHQLNCHDRLLIPLLLLAEVRLPLLETMSLSRGMRPLLIELFELAKLKNLFISGSMSSTQHRSLVVGSTKLRFFGGHMSIFGATGTPVLDFW